MKLLISDLNGNHKEVSLYGKMDFKINNGETFYFPKNFENYEILLTQDQKGILLTFLDNGKSTEVVLNNLVAMLDESDSNVTVVVGKNESFLNNDVEFRNIEKVEDFLIINDTKSLIDNLESSAAGKISNTGYSVDLLDDQEYDLSEIAKTNLGKNLNVEGYVSVGEKTDYNFENENKFIQKNDIDNNVIEEAFKAPDMHMFRNINNEEVTKSYFKYSDDVDGVRYRIYNDGEKRYLMEGDRKVEIVERGSVVDKLYFDDINNILYAYSSQADQVFSFYWYGKSNSSQTYLKQVDFDDIRSNEGVFGFEIDSFVDFDSDLITLKFHDIPSSDIGRIAVIRGQNNVLEFFNEEDKTLELGREDKLTFNYNYNYDHKEEEVKFNYSIIDKEGKESEPGEVILDNGQYKAFNYIYGTHDLDDLLGNNDIDIAYFNNPFNVSNKIKIDFEELLDDYGDSRDIVLKGKYEAIFDTQSEGNQGVNWEKITENDPMNTVDRYFSDNVEYDVYRGTSGDKTLNIYVEKDDDSSGVIL